MSEDYIRVHKPLVSAKSQKKPEQTPKKAKRKSTFSSAHKNRKSTVIHTKTTDIDINEKTYKLFEQKLIQTKLEIHQSLLENTFRNILDYFNFYLEKRDSYDSFVEKNKSSKFIFNPICDVIPTIALYTGINSQDYASLNEKLNDQLKVSFSNFIYSINEKNSANIKQLISSLYIQWVAANEDQEIIVKRNVFTFKHLFGLAQTNNSQDKPDRPDPIIFIFKQFELIPKDTIECFVSLISCYVDQVPIYFIIELASQTNIINEQLNSNIISKLCIKKLYLMTPEQYLEKFLNRLFIEQPTLFRVSGDVLKYLVDVYYDYNYSISHLIHALKFCFYKHVQNNELNALFLNCSLDDFQFHETIQSNLMSDDNHQKKIMSICESVNENNVNICIQKVQQNWIHFHNQFILISRILYEIKKCFHQQDQSQLSFVYFYIKMCSFSCSKNKTRKFIETEDYTNVRNLLQLASSHTMNDLVSTLLNLVKNRLHDEVCYHVDFLNDLDEFGETLSKLKKNLTVENFDNSFNDGDEDSRLSQLELLAEEILSPKKKPTKTAGKPLSELSENSPSKLNSRSILSQHQVLQQKKVISQKQVESLKKSVIQWLGQQFAIYFDTDYSKTENLFSKFFSFSDQVKLKERLFVVQRLSIHEALSNPLSSVKFLQLLPTNSSPRKRSKNSDSPTDDQNEELSNNTKLLKSFTEPLSNAYKLYLECSHMINLYDWLMAFVEKMENADLNDLSPSKRKLVLALYFRSITELQFLGFIKPTNRKVDHVVKLTNGSSALALEN